MQRGTQPRRQVRARKKLTNRSRFAAWQQTWLVSNTGMTRPQNTLVLKASALHFSYPQCQLFTDFSATIPTGFTLVRGGDGRGKTTLLRLLAGRLPAQSGQLHIKGIDLQTQPANYKTQVFWAEPKSDAFDQMSVPEYFDLQRRSHAGFDDAVLTDVVGDLGLSEHLHKQLFMLSTGSKRKVFLAAAFASGAAVTLLDEPFAALDTASIGFVLKWLKGAANDSNRAWVMADYFAPDGLLLEQMIDLGD
jgi:ABC-type multidrug transport system ATPase subunit